MTLQISQQIQRNKAGRWFWGQKGGRIETFMFTVGGLCERDILRSITRLAGLPKRPYRLPALQTKCKN